MKEKLHDFLKWSKDYIVLYFVILVIFCGLLGIKYIYDNTTVEYREILGTVERKSYEHYVTYEVQTWSDGDTVYTRQVEHVHENYNITIVADDYGETIKFTENNSSAYKTFEEGQTVRVEVSMYYWKGEWQSNTYHILIK